MNIACYIRNDVVSRHVQVVLEGAGFGCERLLSETALLRLTRRRSYDLILIELSPVVPDRESLFSWMNCRFGESTPIIMLSSVRSADVTALALDAGADDFVTTPVEPVELVARVHAILRRTNRRTVRRVIELVGFSIDREARTFTYRGTLIELTPREFTMHGCFFRRPVFIFRARRSAPRYGVSIVRSPGARLSSMSINSVKSCCWGLSAGS